MTDYKQEFKEVDSAVYRMKSPQPLPGRWEKFWKKLLFTLHLRNSYPIIIYGLSSDKGFRGNIIRMRFK